MLEKTEGAIENGQSRNTGDFGHTKHRMTTSKTRQENTTLNRILNR